MNAKRQAFLACLMQDAWNLAHLGVKKFGGSPRLYLAASLRIAWQESKPRTVWHPGLGSRFWLPGLAMPSVPTRRGQMFLPGLSAK